MGYMLDTLLFLILVHYGTSVEWDSRTFPNPTAGNYKQCGLKSSGFICDPDSVLTEGERYRLNHELVQLEAKTRQDYGRNFCEKKGFTAAIAVVKHVRGGNEADVREMANDLLQRWTLDEQCQKSMVMVVSVDDRKFWVARDPKIPVVAQDFNNIFNAQKPLFQQRDNQKALSNVIRGTAEVAKSKQGQLPSGPTGGGDRGGDKRPGEGPVGGGMPFKFTMPPTWIIVAIIFIVIPILICCCVCYCCCCRNRGGSNNAGGDPESGGGGRGGGGGGLSSFMQGMGGAAVMNMIQNCFRNSGQRSAAGRGGGGAYPRGDYNPGQPVAEEGKGLYPSREVKDEGGGGGW